MSAPIAAVEVWQAVMERAGYRCECTWRCHSVHRKDEHGRCYRMHPDHTPVVEARARLLAGPRDPGPHPERTVTTVSAEDLVAWCPECWDYAVKTARRYARREALHALTDSPGLF